MNPKRYPVFALLLVLLFAFGCDKCGNKEATIPATPKERVQDIATHMPAKVEALVFLSDLKKTREGINVVKDRFSGLGFVEGFEKSFQTNFGLNLTDRESWKRAGIAPDATAAIGAYRSRIIFTTYVENRQQFEKILTDKAKNAFQIKSVTKNETVGGHKMKILSDDPARQIAWLYKGKLAIVCMPATSVKEALDDGTGSLVLADIAGTKKEVALGSTEGFKAFQKDIGEASTVSVFFNPVEYMNSDDFKAAMKDNPEVEAGAAWTKQNVQYAGLGVNVTDNQADAKLRVGMKGDVAKQVVDALKPPQKFDWNGFSTQLVLLGLRFSFDAKKVWKLITDNLPDEDRRGMQRSLKMQSQALNLDIETEIINKLTGNIGVFFYGVSGGIQSLMPGASKGADPWTKAGLIVSLQFDEPASVTSAVDKMMSPLAMMLSRKPVTIDDAPVEGWEMLEVTGPGAPGRLYINGANVYFATMALAPKSVIEYATNKRSEGRLKDAEGMDLGKAFAGEAPFNGLYLNAARLRDNVGPMLMMYPQASFLNDIEEASLKLDAEPNGGIAHLVIDLKPKKGTDTVTDGAKDDKPKEEPTTEDKK